MCRLIVREALGDTGGEREGAGGLGGEPWDGIASHPGGNSNTPGRFMAKETR